MTDVKTLQTMCAYTAAHSLRGLDLLA